MYELGTPPSDGYRTSAPVLSGTVAYSAAISIPAQSGVRVFEVSHDDRFAEASTRRITVDIADQAMATTDSEAPRTPGWPGTAAWG